MAALLIAIGVVFVVLRIYIEDRTRRRVYYCGLRSGYDKAVALWLSNGEEQDSSRAYAAGFMEAQRRASDLIEADAGEEEWRFTQETVDSMLPHGRFVDEDGNDWTPFGTCPECGSYLDDACCDNCADVCGEEDPNA